MARLAGRTSYSPRSLRLTMILNAEGPCVRSRLRSMESFVEEVRFNILSVLLALINEMVLPSPAQVYETLLWPFVPDSDCQGRLSSRRIKSLQEQLG